MWDESAPSQCDIAETGCPLPPVGEAEARRPQAIPVYEFLPCPKDSREK